MDAVLVVVLAEKGYGVVAGVAQEVVMAPGDDLILSLMREEEMLLALTVLKAKEAMDVAPEQREAVAKLAMAEHPVLGS